MAPLKFSIFCTVSAEPYFYLQTPAGRLEKVYEEEDEDIFGDSGFGIDTLEQFGTGDAAFHNGQQADINCSSVAHLYSAAGQKKKKKKKKRQKKLATNGDSELELRAPDPVEVGDNLVQTDGGCDDRMSRMDIQAVKGQNIGKNDQEDEIWRLGHQEKECPLSSTIFSSATAPSLSTSSSSSDESLRGLSPVCEAWSSLNWILQCDGGEDSGSNSDSENGLG